MKRLLLILVALLALASLPASAQYQRAFGWCEQGGVKIKTNGQQSSVPVQASYPACTVTVYNGSTTNLATIFSDANHTQPLANPFASASNGLWGFYAANGTYDVQYSGTGITTPFSIAGYQLGSSGGGGGGGGTVGPGTVNNLAKFSTTTNVGNATCTDDGITPMACGLGVSLIQNALFTVKTNNPTTGTTCNQLVARDSSGRAILAQPTDGNNVIGIAGYNCGTTGSVSIAYTGQFTCKTANQTAIGDWATKNPTSGECLDAGATQPSGVETIGRFITVNGGAHTNAGVDMGQPDVTNTSSGGGTGIVGPCATASAVTYYPTASSTTGCDASLTTDGAGNATATSVTTTGTGAGYFASQQGAAPTLSLANTAYLYSGTSVATSFGTALPSTPGTAGQALTITSVPDATHIVTGWTTAGGGGGATSVGLAVNGTSPSGIFSVTGSPVTTSGALNLVTTGTSGGIPYFSSGTTVASSGALTANLPVIGGGAGVSPTVGSRTGNTTQFATWTGATTASRCVQTDASGNLVISTASCSALGSFTSLTGGTNTSAAMVVGTGASLATTGSGTIVATSLSTTLPIAGGGTGATTQPNAAIAIFPTATRAGDVVYWDGAIWNHLAGNNSGTNILQENSSGVPSWAAATSACPTCVTSAASLTSTALMTGAGSQASQTPSATSTLDASGNMSLAGKHTSVTYATATNCAATGTSANPSVVSCSAAASGAFACATNASTGTCQVNTTAVNTASRIFIQPTAAANGLTCNAVSDTGLTGPRLLSQSNGASFTITLGTFATTALCFNYWIVN